MKTFLTVVVLAVFSLCSGAAAMAQQGVMWRGGGGWGSGMPYSRMFNPQTVETIRGVVVLVEKIAPMRGMANGVHAVVKTDKETISVHLGPDWYITNQDVRIEANDQVEVKGSRITIEGAPALIAEEVKKGEDVLMLRDGSGMPVWAGWRRR